MKNKKSLILVILLTCCFGAVLYAVKEYNRKPESLETIKEDFAISAGQLIGQYSQEQKTADQKFLGKTILVKGKINSIDITDKKNITVVLGSDGEPSSIRCSIDTLYMDKLPALKEQDSVHLRGVCTGYIPDDMGLGADIILNRCYLTEKIK
ncbi:OB-fold putative lipoprotein [Flavihumibacter profundi]|uniref:OB-fold putative lipoprotein n=1 Tax=Flavihumibacter profundi TaxID=2716883 RepID=UPI001CC703A2|nr:OB-fold putative lipoprotein [Flavihumibacter profundi]MBZ5858688.1 OB-fold putative lipoprotein [Flavihumibacter profundi]